MVTRFEQHQSGRIKVNKSNFFLTFSPSAYKLELSGFIYLFSSWQQVLFGCKFFLYTLDKQCILRILIRNTGVHMYNLLTITENFFYIYHHCDILLISLGTQYSGLSTPIDHLRIWLILGELFISEIRNQKMTTHALALVQYRRVEGIAIYKYPIKRQ